MIDQLNSYIFYVFFLESQISQISMSFFSYHLKRVRKSVILRFRYEPPPVVGGCPQILMYLSYFGGFLMYLSYLGGFLMYLRENWPPIGGQKILSISVMFLEANSFRNSKKKSPAAP